MVDKAADLQAQRGVLDLSEERLNHTILQLSLPAIVENLLQTMVFLVNTIFVGRLGDPVALAAIGMAGTLIFILNSLFDALSMGIVPIIARSWGRRDFAHAQAAGGQAISLSIALAAVVVAAAARATVVGVDRRPNRWLLAAADRRLHPQCKPFRVAYGFPTW